MAKTRQANKFILLYAWCDNHRGWLASKVPLQFGRFSGVPSLLVIQNWRFSAAWSSCIASVVPWTATFSCPEYNIDSRFSTLDYRILLVQGFGNGTSTKTIAGKLFGRRRVKWWLRRVTCLMLGISLPNCATECAKNPSGTWEKKKKKNLSDVI